jgi:hypothetical protein
MTEKSGHTIYAFFLKNKRKKKKDLDTIEHGCCEMLERLFNLGLVFSSKNLKTF